MLRTTTAAYDKYAKLFYECQKNVYGDVTHYYATDPFHEGGDTGDMSTSDVSSEVLNSMLEFDKDAVWVIQAWQGNPSAGLINGLNGRKEHALVLDLYAEKDTHWNDSSYSGGKEFQKTPWVYCMLNNFGGRMGLHGHMDNIVSGVVDAANNSEMLTGIGIGVSLSVGGSTGGTDIIAMLVTKYHNVSPGRVLMVCDFCVIAMTLLIYDHVDREAFGGLIYGYVMMGIVSFTVDYVLTGKTQSAQLFIFTDKYDEVARELTNQVHRGVTLIDAKGWYTGQDKKIILIVARKHEASDVLRIAKQIDPDVFMTMAPVMGVFGKGFEEVKGVK